MESGNRTPQIEIARSGCQLAAGIEPLSFAPGSDNASHRPSHPWNGSIQSDLPASTSHSLARMRQRMSDGPKNARRTRLRGNLLGAICRLLKLKAPLSCVPCNTYRSG